MESILISIKKLLGLSPDYAPFDDDIIMHINTYLGVLNQLGVGKRSYRITGDTETWSDFLEGTSGIPLDEAKTYLYLRVKMVFDPPTSSIVQAAINQNIDELGWRLREAVEYSESTSNEVIN